MGHGEMCEGRIRKGYGKICGVMDMFLSWFFQKFHGGDIYIYIYIYMSKHQIVHIKYMRFILYQLWQQSYGKKERKRERNRKEGVKKPFIISWRATRSKWNQEWKQWNDKLCAYVV